MNTPSGKSQHQVTAKEILVHFPQLFTEIIGDPDIQVSGVAAPDEALATHAVFLATPKAFALGVRSPAKLLIIGTKQRAEALANRADRTLLIANNVERAMAAVINRYFLATPFFNPKFTQIHSTVIIGSNTEIAEGVRIGPNVVIGSNVNLGKNVCIGANSVIEDHVSIDESTVVHPLVYVGPFTTIGKRCEINSHSAIGKEGFGYAHDERFNHYRIPHQGRVVIEDDVHLGASNTIDRGTFKETRICFGVKTDNRVHIAHNCQIGPNSMLTAGFVIGGSGKVGANFVSGGNTMVSGHIEICDNVQLAAATAAGKSIQKPGSYGGLPLMPLQQYIKTKVALVHLVEMRKQFKQVLEKLGLQDETSKNSAEDL